MTHSTEVNPYAAPADSSRFRGLSPDTEFLVSGECVLGGELISLPRVCIATGRTTGLKSEETRLKWTPRWMVNVRTLLTVVGLPILFGFVIQNLRSQPGGVPVWAQVLPWVIVITITVLGVAAWILAFRFTSHVKITWFVKEEIFAAEERRRRTWRFILMTCIVAAVLLGYSGFAVWSPWMPLVFWGLLITALAASFRLKPKHRPQFLGQHEGLNVVLLSEHFTRTVRSIIEQQSESVNGPGADKL